MTPNKRAKALQLYLLLAILFVTALVVCNLIANKFIPVSRTWLGFDTPFQISAGVLPYPVTFLITDILSEFYGRRKTNQVVGLGLIASIFVLGILWLGGQFPALDFSPVDDTTYNAMFGNSWRVIAASMVAYLVAQLVDVRLFHFWKNLTKGKFLWLRNNASTIVSQLVDTTLVVLVLFFGERTGGEMLALIISGWAFKALCAALDTPIVYLIVYGIRKYFGLKPGEELSI